MFWYTLIKTSELKEWKEKWQGYYVAEHFDKRKNDRQLKKDLPKWVTEDMIAHWLIDRKQGKIAILLK